MPGSRFKKVVLIALCIYTLLLLDWMFVGFGRSIRQYQEYNYNLQPFRTINRYLAVDNFRSDIWIINLIGNIVVFMPFGIFLPLLYRWSFAQFIAFFTVSVLLLEILQLVSRRGSFDVDDLILNVLGATIGYGIYRVSGQALEK